MKNLEKRLKEYNKRPKLSKKQERKVKRKIQNVRRELRRQQEIAHKRHDLWVDEHLEKQRILREMADETDGT